MFALRARFTFHSLTWLKTCTEFKSDLLKRTVITQSENQTDFCAESMNNSPQGAVQTSAGSGYNHNVVWEKYDCINQVKVEVKMSSNILLGKWYCQKNWQLYNFICNFFAFYHGPTCPNLSNTAYVALLSLSALVLQVSHHEFAASSYIFKIKLITIWWLLDCKRCEIVVVWLVVPHKKTWLG